MKTVMCNICRKAVPLIVGSLFLLVALGACQQQSPAAPTGILSATVTVSDALTVVTPTATLAESDSPSATRTQPADSVSETQVPPSSTTPLPTDQSRQPGESPTPGAPGALIGVSMRSQVGVLLDEIPPDMRSSVVATLRDQGESAWVARAMRQVRLTRLRLNFRSFVYDGLRGQLPLPSSDLWNIRLDPTGPRRQTVQGHDLMMITYTLRTTILTDEMSPGLAEPLLAEVGGIWEEPFVFPADPDLLLQRTGNACVNEGGFPPSSYDSENVWHFYDYECTADSGGATGCHRLFLPTFSCLEALEGRIGEVRTSLRFERLAWDEALAEEVRRGPFAGGEAPDLMVVGEDLTTHRVVYRYFEPDDCAIEEGAVGADGWRRLLLFDATVHNIGGSALHIGPVVTEDLANNVFDYNMCHDHFHYTNYGEFFVDSGDSLTTSKQAFCVQSTNRISNHETSPLVHDYSCRFQGIQAGWVDEYIAGLDTQWIDITDLKPSSAGQSVQLGFRSNADRFLCEGSPVLNEDGEQIWEPSGLITNEGEPINRPVCEFIDNWDANNVAEHEVFVPATGGFITQPCRNNEIGPLRNCGFQELQFDAEELICRPGQAVTLPLQTIRRVSPQVLRVCERSRALATGVACGYEESVANMVIGASDTSASFTCPRLRDASAGDLGGGFALYLAPVLPGDLAAPPPTGNSD